jgi:hypothetical protein
MRRRAEPRSNGFVSQNRFEIAEYEVGVQGSAEAGEQC